MSSHVWQSRIRQHNAVSTNRQHPRRFGGQVFILVSSVGETVVLMISVGVRNLGNVSRFLSPPTSYVGSCERWGPMYEEKNLRGQGLSEMFIA